MSTNKFSLNTEDKVVIDRLLDAIELLAQRANLSAPDQHYLASLRFGLERLPLQSKGLSVDLGLAYTYNNESSGVAIRLDESVFRIWQGGIAYNELVGSDTYGDTLLEVEFEGVRICDNYFELGDVADRFISAAGDSSYKLDVSSDEDGDIDWRSEPDPEAWDDLPSAF